MKKYCNSYAVIGLGFGDEGKGMAVHSLCYNLGLALVVRYSGGQQAGHTVTLDNGVSHVFSNFGSGTLVGNSTYWSHYCTFDPVGVVNELKVLGKKAHGIRLYIDKRCPVTTPYDKFHNQNSEAITHGTCGAGVGATYKREENFQSLLVGDMLFQNVFEMKLNFVKKYYGNNAEINDFWLAVDFIRKSPIFQFVEEMPGGYVDYVFEGSQGLLLDQNIGFFPHVTRSNVGTKNILEMGFEPRLFLVTRAFQTRHGNGPLVNEHLTHNITENPNETNTLNRYQGEFRKSLLDLDLLKYGMSRDEYIKNSPNKELVITCLDLVSNEYRYTAGGKIVGHSNEDDFVNGISEYLGIEKVHRVSSPSQMINPHVFNRASNG